MQVDFYSYQEVSFSCTKCNWEGKGVELLHGDFNEVDLIGNLECPSCHNLIAFWQAPSANGNHFLDKEE